MYIEKAGNLLTIGCFDGRIEPDRGGGSQEAFLKQGFVLIEEDRRTGEMFNEFILKSR